MSFIYGISKIEKMRLKTWKVKYTHHAFFFIKNHAKEGTKNKIAKKGIKGNIKKKTNAKKDAGKRCWKIFGKSNKIIISSGIFFYNLKKR